MTMSEIIDELEEELEEYDFGSYSYFDIGIYDLINDVRLEKEEKNA